MSYAYWEQTRVRPEASAQGPGPSSSPTTPKSPRRASSVAPVQIFAGVVGAVFILIGILGFVPGITRMFGDFALFGRDSKSELLGLFEVSALHNVVHLLFGVGVLAARKASTAQLYLIVGGVLYLVVGLYGSIIDRPSSANFLPFNQADNILHFGLSIGMILLGIVGGLLLRRSSPSAA